MEAHQISKTGSTPIVEEGVGGGEVLGVVECKTVLVKLRDGHGKEITRLAVVIPGGDVVFVDDTAMKTKPAQAWVRNGVLSALALKP